jgi:hypothetical protein
MMESLSQQLQKLQTHRMPIKSRLEDRIGRRLLSHVEKLRQLRAEIDKGIRLLDAGVGAPLDVEEFLRHENERHSRA